MKARTMEDILNILELFKSAYDRVQLVDPVNKRIIKMNADSEEFSPLYCFSLWQKNQICDDCVSIRAYRDNKTYFKIDYIQDQIYLITAIPVDLDDRRVVLELFKNTTDGLVIKNKKMLNQSDGHSVMDGLNDIAFKDSLTGIYNRRYINEKLPLNMVSTSMEGKSLSIIMADIDFFKNINDTYGHLAGDYTLKSLADILLRNLKRESDWVARYGGEEFLICLPGAKQEIAAEIAEIMRKKVEDSIFEYGEYQFKITASFGVSSTALKGLMSMEELIGKADKKLYEAKHNGRNRVEA